MNPSCPSADHALTIIIIDNQYHSHVQTLRDKMTPTEGGSILWKNSDSLSTGSTTPTEHTVSMNEAEDDSHPLDVVKRPDSLGMEKILGTDHDGGGDEEGGATDRTVDWYDKLVGSASSGNGKKHADRASEVISRATVIEPNFMEMPEWSYCR